MQGNRICQTLILSSLIFGFSLPSYAAVPSCKGWYLEGNVGRAKVWDGSYAGPVSYPSFPSGWNVNAGYKFLAYLAGEVGYTSYYLQKSYSAIVSDFNDTQAGKAQLTAVDAVVKVIVPIGATGIELFGKAGGALSIMKIRVTNSTAANNIGLVSNTSTALGPYGGIGASYSLTPDFTVNTQWTAALGNGNIAKGQLISLGMAFIFSS